MSVFRDRRQAGEQLAEKLRGRGLDDPVVLALPRGGVPVASCIAAKLNAPLDIAVVRKIGAPHNPEAAIGAVTAEGDPLFDRGVLAWLRLEESDLAHMVATERAEARRRVAAYRGDRPATRIEGRDAVVVDDGLATGMSARAALTDLRDRRPASLTLAVPACSADAVRSLAGLCDAIVCLHTPGEFRAVSLWYEHFPQVSDDEVQHFLHQAAAGRPA
ncbi:MAG: phosphoribosyltransferase family protein [Nocardiopsaceae bacterium]|nr:phosphoribosyltransferase family protein [Nocardiopsaceae bacterium]